MFLQHSYHHPHQRIHLRPPHVHPLQVEEVVEEVAEEDKQTLQQRPASDSVETLQRYSQEIERKQTASSPNSNDTTWPISESQSSTPGSERSSSPAPTSKDLLSINGSIEQWTGSHDWIL